MEMSRDSGKTCQGPKSFNACHHASKEFVPVLMEGTAYSRERAEVSKAAWSRRGKEINMQDFAQSFWVGGASLKLNDCRPEANGRGKLLAAPSCVQSG
jgi:hypothetical protein